MAKILQSSWVISLTGCLLYLGTTALLLQPVHFAAARAVDAAPMSPNNDPSWKFRNPEFEQWVEEIRREKEALGTREQQLNELQTRLEAERQEILSVTQTVHQLQADFDKNVVRLQEAESENLKRQTKIIAGMSPEGAAAMLNEMPDNQVVAILFSLKPETASLMLDTISKMGKPEAKRAAALAERLRVVLPPGR